MEKSVLESSPTHLRIADILLIKNEEEEDGGDLLMMMEGFRGRRREGCSGIVSRWLSWLRKGKVKRILVGGDEREEKDAARDTKCSMNVLSGGDLSSTVMQNDQTGGCRCGRGCSFNMGVGYSLLYLVAASKSELDKMTELRTQMEMLLQNSKEELQLKNKNTLVKPSDSNDIFVHPNADCSEKPEPDYHHSTENLATSYVIPESSTAITTCQQSLKCDTPKEEEFLNGIDKLQAELEVELEHLQFRLGKEKLLLYPQQQSIEVTVKDTSSSSSTSYNFSSGEIIDPLGEPQNACTEVHNGVHPYELERRLHEVLEERQQEHIRELEAALEYSRLKLREKEIEISWWKDTAKFISQHVPGSSSCFTERG